MRVLDGRIANIVTEVRGLKEALFTLDFDALAIRAAITDNGKALSNIQGEMLKIGLPESMLAGYNRYNA